MANADTQAFTKADWAQCMEGVKQQDKKIFCSGFYSLLSTIKTVRLPTYGQRTGCDGNRTGSDGDRVAEERLV
jgi:hypothetical protein